MVTTVLYFAGYMVMKVPQAFWPLTILVVFDNGKFFERGASNQCCPDFYCTQVAHWLPTLQKNHIKSNAG